MEGSKQNGKQEEEQEKLDKCQLECNNKPIINNQEPDQSSLENTEEGSDKNPKNTLQQKISECIRRINSAWANKDYFRVLELPYPELDAWGQPLWSVSADGVVKAYRKITKFIHPDKNPSEEAKKAFIIATQVKDTLINDRGGALRDTAWLVKKLEENTTAQEDWQTRIHSSLLKTRQKEQQRTQEMKKFESNIADKLKWRAYDMKNKRRRKEEEEQNDGSEDDWEAAAAQKQDSQSKQDTVVIKKHRKKPKTLF